MVPSAHPPPPTLYLENVILHEYTRQKSLLHGDFFEQEEDEDVAESLGLLEVGNSDPQQTILFQLPSVLPSPAKEIKSEPLDRRRRLGVTQALEHQPALSLKDLPPGKVPQPLPSLVFSLEPGQNRAPKIEDNAGWVLRRHGIPAGFCSLVSAPWTGATLYRVNTPSSDRPYRRWLPSSDQNHGIRFLGMYGVPIHVTELSRIYGIRYGNMGYR